MRPMFREPVILPERPLPSEPVDPEEQAASVPPPRTDGAPRRLSDLLDAVASAPVERLTLREIAVMMGDRAFAAIMFVFGFLNAIPTGLPGISSVLGAPLLFVTFQLMLGRSTLWLPGVIADRSISTADFAAINKRVRPWIMRAERLLRPRILFLTGRAADRLIGFICFLLSVLIFLPIPLGNALPGAAVALFALALFERDGIAMLSGLATAIGSIVIVSGVLYAIIKGTLLLIAYLFQL